MKIRKTRWDWKKSALATWVIGAVVAATTVFSADLPITQKGQWPGFSRGLVQGVWISGHYAYVTYDPGFDGNPWSPEFDASGVAIFDVSDPAHSKPVGNLVTGGYPKGIQVVGSHAYVAAEDAGFVVADVSNPAHPVRLSSLAAWPRGVHVVGNYAYLADDVADLLILDISNPANPVRVSDISTGGTANEVQVVGRLSGNVAYVADGNLGLQIVDVSDPAHPVRLGTWQDATGAARSVAVLGNYAYVADGTGLQVIDVSDPTQPMRVGSLATSELSRTVRVAGHYAYVARLYSTMQVIDVSDPTNPVAISEGGIFQNLHSTGDGLQRLLHRLEDLRRGFLDLAGISGGDARLLQIGAVDCRDLSRCVSCNRYEQRCQRTPSLIVS